ncbi:type VI secretion system baseplate subunit TssK [Chitinibacter sp. ZOR0017]|uniref:type VI secretion system baseplate subunit TssK n=1 Tax=Chitinibacter sp. ZOR0017 TaxID=1339254 RepID=UPI00064603A1|nr:type VI secretion system baseplate subunit TssK [Chitinibacter sp. ZOR0017]
MIKAKRVLWGEGMFLRPQHFQQQHLFTEAALSTERQLFHRYAWGVRRFQIDQEALRGGQIRLDQLEVLFKDGTQCAAPLHDPLPLGRNLQDIPQLGVSTTLYVCVAQLQAYGGNAINPDQQANRPARFRTNQSPISDLYTQALDADLSTLELDIRLMFEEENRDGYEQVALAKLQKNAAGQWEIASDFFPPSLTTSAVGELSNLLRRLLDILLVKSQSLAGAHRERAKNVMEYGTSDIASFWLLHTVNRNFARLNHLARCEPLHPEELYQALCEFCGELQTFSPLYTLADIPAYQHDDLFQVFNLLDLQIRELLETVISARYAIIPLHSPKPSFFIGRLESERLLENVDYYLSIQSDMPATAIIENVPLKFKVGAPDDVEKILNSAMRGVSLSHASQTPSAVPVRVGNHYFAFEPRGDIFQRMQQSRSICIYVPQSLAELKLELIAVFR